MSRLGEPARQRGFLDELCRRVPAIPWVETVILVGSLAADRADAASDVDLLVGVRDGMFAEAWRGRDALRATGAVLAWDHRLDRRRGSGAHKWITPDLVLGEALIAVATSGVRLATPWRVLAGDADAVRRWPTRAPISPAELRAGSAELHPAELAYDEFKLRLRRAARD